MLYVDLCYQNNNNVVFFSLSLISDIYNENCMVGQKVNTYYLSRNSAKLSASEASSECDTRRTTQGYNILDLLNIIFVKYSMYGVILDAELQHW